MSSTNFTVPKGVKKIDCFCVGGGGAADSDCRCSGGGGGGYTSTKLGVDVNPGQDISVVVGAGQINNSIFNQTGTAPSSCVGSICSANGGFSACGEYDIDKRDGGSGGSGGGKAGANGGSDGGNGSANFEGFTGGQGQGTTTRYFGESNGTLYAGGGGGAGQYRGDDSPNVATFTSKGGDGGGGKGAYAWLFYGWNELSSAEPGSPNTGGGAGGSLISSGSVTGGGGGGYTTTKLAQSVTPGSPISVVVGAGGVCSLSEFNGKNGGSGICIIRWDDQKS